MVRNSVFGGALALSLCAGCATAPPQTADVDVYTPKVYRTGSNIPVKDYGAEPMEVRSPDVINPINRPMGGTRIIP